MIQSQKRWHPSPGEDHSATDSGVETSPVNTDEEEVKTEPEVEETEDDDDTVTP